MSHCQSGAADGMSAGSALRLFRVRRRPGAITQLTRRPVAVERTLQALLERHLLAVLDVHFLATEYATGARHGGRIDTLGIDRAGNPVVIEYKRDLSVNQITQGLFYLDWLDDHRGEFRLLVQERLGPAGVGITWRNPRLICVAAGFSRYDLRAVQQIGRRIELVEYGWYGDDLLVLATPTAAWG